MACLKNKELIALTSDLKVHCDTHIGFHAKTLMDLGATIQEIGKVLEMTVCIGGGLSLACSANALTAFKNFSKD